MADAQIMMHCGAELATEEDVRGAECPDGTDTWRPINHGYALDLALGAIDSMGFEIRRSEFALQDGVLREGRAARLKATKIPDARLFGVFDLKMPWGNGDDYTMALGLRNSTDQRFAYSLVAGSRVFVCDNLAFSGAVEMKHKHTTRMLEKLPGLISMMMERAGDLYIKDAERFEAWKDRPITSHQASDFICEVAAAGDLPSRGILPVRDAFLDSPNEEFRNPTVWSLYNAFSEAAKGMRIDPHRHAARSMAQTMAFRRRWPVLPGDEKAEGLVLNAGTDGAQEPLAPVAHEEAAEDEEVLHEADLD